MASVVLQAKAGGCRSVAVRQAGDARLSVGSEICKSPEGSPDPLELAEQAHALSNSEDWLHDPDILGNSLTTLHLPRGLARGF